MVRTVSDARRSDSAAVEILANLSLSLDQLAAVFLGLSAVTLIVAMLPTLMGYWPILAIALAHLGIVGWCLRLAWRGHWQRQLVTVGVDHVEVRSVRADGAERVFWPTGWVRVETVRVGREPRVFLRLHRKRIELGRFVPADERLEAAAKIREALAPYSAWSSNRIAEQTASRE